MNTMTEKAKRRTAQEIEAVMREEKPHLAEHLSYDRSWLWYCGEKPSDTDREWIKELGFRYKTEGHVTPDGREGRWYYWDRIPPKYNKGSKGNNNKPQQQQQKPQPQPQQQQQQQLSDADIEAAIRKELGL